MPISTHGYKPRVGIYMIVIATGYHFTLQAIVQIVFRSSKLRLRIAYKINQNTIRSEVRKHNQTFDFLWIAMSEPKTHDTKYVLYCQCWRGLTCLYIHKNWVPWQYKARTFDSSVTYDNGALINTLTLLEDWREIKLVWLSVPILRTWKQSGFSQVPLINYVKRLA
jgi:hypothetical protein